jgi:ankyrin repeat protein
MTKQNIFDHACENEDLILVKKLLRDSEVEPDANDSYGLRWATNNNHVEIVKLLLEDGRADPMAEQMQAVNTVWWMMKVLNLMPLSPSFY